MQRARTIAQCFHAYGVHSVTLQPEFAGRHDCPVEGDYEEMAGTGEAGTVGRGSADRSEGLRQRVLSVGRGCRIVCGTGCGGLSCCG